MPSNWNNEGLYRVADVLGMALNMFSFCSIVSRIFFFLSSLDNKPIWKGRYCCMVEVDVDSDNEGERLCLK